MKEMVQNRMVTVRVVGMLGTRALVELIDKSVAPHVSASKALIDSGFAIKEKDVADKGSSMHTASGK
jgi:tudor domain-containing protein 1/4/6/7